MSQGSFDWIHLLARWVHITTGITWIGTSIFFMWLDRSLQKKPGAEGPGELWMVHGGGFYQVQKMKMGSVPVPETLHWFKWESYWTWMSGVFLMILIFYLGGGIFLLDSTVSSISYGQAVGLGIFSVLGSWFYYDFLWERKITRDTPWVGHVLTLVWAGAMTFILCKTLSGRAAYMHVGAMLGTWMTGNVFMRIIPRQAKMVEAAKAGKPVNPDWSKNAKSRSTHNTYFTLPVIFIMLSNHFPGTYGHPWNWLILLLIGTAGASIREFFVSRASRPGRAHVFASAGVALLFLVFFLAEFPAPTVQAQSTPRQVKFSESDSVRPGTVHGRVSWEGAVPEPKRLELPPGCGDSHGNPVYANDILIHDGMLQNVLIRITRGLEGKKFSDVPSASVVIDQRGCVYHPRVAAARVGQEVVFVNSDPVFHNVKTVSRNNPEFNEAMPIKDQRISKRFDHPEILLQAKCSVHPWMGVYIAILDHPYYAISDENGGFQIQGLPDGTYTLEAWHEAFGTQTQVFTMNHQEPQTIHFTFRKEK